MSLSGNRIGRSLVALTALCAACTNAQLYDLAEQGTPPLDREMTLNGKFCALGPNQVVSPIKILFVMDASGSMRKSDPNGTRATAVVNLMESLPDNPNVYFAVMLFSGFDTRFFTKTGTATFDSVTSYSTADFDALVDRILIYQNTGTAGPNQGNTDFVKPLDTAYAMIDNDIANSHVGIDGGLGLDIAPARYTVIFLSDGSPTVPQDPAIKQAVLEITGLSSNNPQLGTAESVTLNTVHISPPPGTTCDVNDAGILDCAALQFQQDAERLETMAAEGNGQFRDFENNEPVNFLSFNVGVLFRAYLVKQFYVSNFSAPPDSPLNQVDSDSDGLSDWLELDAGLDPHNPDTTGDGFSDGVKWTIFTKEDGTINPYKVNPGCAPNLIHVDSDCDGIWDCDEQLLGGNTAVVDTDFDGAPDGIEWRLGTQLTTQDLGFDPDSDGVENGVELRLHTNPQVADANDLSVTGYRYELAADGPIDANGVQCYDFSVSNVQLANTLDVGRGPGYNDLYLAFAMVPDDNPSAPTVMRQARYRDARYPVEGIKSPADGVINFTTADFFATCNPIGPATWVDVP